MLLFLFSSQFSQLFQIAMALPLLIGIVPESLNATALFETLIQNIVEVNQYHVTTVRTSSAMIHHRDSLA